MARSIAKSSTCVFLDSTAKELIQILHVDDEINLLKVAKQCLEMEGGFQVEVVSSVKEALKQIRRKHLM